MGRRRLDQLKELIERLEYIHKEIAYVIGYANKNNISSGADCAVHELTTKKSKKRPARTPGESSNV